MFRIRLIQVAKYNMMIGAAICAAVVVFRMVCGIWEFDGNMALFCLAVLVLSVFSLFTISFCIMSSSHTRKNECEESVFLGI